ncbi:GIY-YIG catalytic domain-containing endonuclease [Paramecium bursaria Chlorella virus NE-JV-1]|nr:GIY-YIG catalytic domain-containing endonuclease [Paramecium bursaria Chlorella virus NE-JV-1]
MTQISTKMGYIYFITSKSGKMYIGQTIRIIEKRFHEHQSPDSECVAISNAIKKYGWENMKTRWYEVPDEYLNDYEELMILAYGSLSPGGYNLREGGGSRGKHSEESRQKMRDAKIGENNHNYGKPRSEETKKKMSESHTGKTVTEETRQKIREANTGRIITEETRQKFREANSGENNPFYGKMHTEESKKKISVALRGENHPRYGKNLSDDHKRKIGEANAGKNRTEETKQKIREANTDRIITEETRQKLREANSGENNPFYGKTHTEETKRKIREANTGKIASDETKKKLSEANKGANNVRSIKVYQYDLDGTFIDSFASSGEAARRLHKTSGSLICQCARGKYDTAYGFKWTREKL